MSSLYTNKIDLIRQDIKYKGFSTFWGADIEMSHDLKLSLRCLESAYDHSRDEGPGRRRFYSRYVLGPHATVEDIDFQPQSNSFLSSDYRQAPDINPEQHGALRSYAPLPASLWSNAFLKEVILFDLAMLPLKDIWTNAKRNPIAVGMHLIRMVARPGQPAVASPSVPHQDGEPFTFIHLINRRGVNGGYSQIFRNTPINGVSSCGELLLQTTLQHCLDTLVIWDKEVFHHVTEVEVGDGSAEGVRDVLIIDFSPLEECKFNSMGELGCDPSCFRTSFY